MLLSFKTLLHCKNKNKQTNKKEKKKILTLQCRCFRATAMFFDVFFLSRKILVAIIFLGAMELQEVLEEDMAKFMIKKQTLWLPETLFFGLFGFFCFGFCFPHFDLCRCWSFHSSLC